MKMEKSQVLVWEIYETADGGKVVIVNTKPYKWLHLTQTVRDNMLPIIRWREAGLSSPAAVVLEQWESVCFEKLTERIGMLQEQDLLRVAVSYAKSFTCM